MFPKFCHVTFVLILGMTFVATPSKASPIQIAVLDITTNSSPGITVERVFTSNLTSGDLTFLNVSQVDPFLTVPFFVDPVVGPRANHVSVFNCLNCSATTLFFLSGKLDALDFSTGGQNFEVTTLNFTTPQFSGDFNGSVPVTIDAAVVSTTPEPASILLFGTGLLGMALMLRKSLLA